MPSPPSCTKALILTLLPTLFLTGVSPLLTSNDCRWPDGTDSNGRIPCNPNAQRSSCCLGTEVCLENNLCFGGVGLIYRSACAGGWGDNETCPEFCNDVIPNKWANIWPCPGKGDEGPTRFWCGFGDVCNTSVTVNSSFFLIDNYKFQAKAIIGNPATITPSSSATAAPPSTSAPLTSSTICPEDDNKTVAVGAGVGVPLAALAMGLAGWALVERRRRKKMSVGGGLQLPPAGMFARQAEKAELAAVAPHHREDDPCFRRHELQ